MAKVNSKMVKTGCPLGLVRCSHKGQPKHCTICSGCQCRGKYKNLCRGRADAHFYPTLEQREQLDMYAKALGDFGTGPFKNDPDPANLIERIVGEYLARVAL